MSLQCRSDGMHRHKKPCSYLSCQLTAYLDCLQCALQGSWDCSDITHAQQALQQVGLCSHVLTARCFAGWLGHNRLYSRLPFFLGLLCTSTDVAQTPGFAASCPSQTCFICNVLCRSTEIAHIHHTLQQVALPTHIWRRHGLPGRPDGGKASLADMLHKPDTTLEQVRRSSYAAYGALNE